MKNRGRIATRMGTALFAVGLVAFASLSLSGCKEDFTNGGKGGALTATNPSGTQLPNTGQLGILPGNPLDCDANAVANFTGQVDHVEVQVEEIDAKPLGDGPIARIPVSTTTVSFPDTAQTIPSLVAQLPKGMYTSFRLVVTGDQAKFFMKNGDTDTVSLSESGDLPSGLMFVPASGVLEVAVNQVLTLDICLAPIVHFDPLAISPPSVKFLASMQSQN